MPATSRRGPGALGQALAYATAAVGVAFALLLVNRGWLAAPLYETLDLAINSLIIQDAKRLELLTGPFSRVGFHHPGPAIIYVLAFGEAVFHDALGWVASPIAGQLVAACLYNAAWTAILLWIAARMWRSLPAALATVAVFLALSTMRDPQNLVGMWLPYLYYLPFAVFTAAIARLAAGKLDGFWALVLAGGVLVHGHAAFGAICGLMFAGALPAYAIAVRGELRSLGPREHLRAAIRAHSAAFIAAAAIAALLALPILLHTVLHFPGEIVKYLTYSRQSGGNPWLGAVGIVHVFATTPLVVALVACMALVWWRGVETMWVLPGTLWAVALATLAALLYAKTGIDDLVYTYTLLFYYGAVVFAVAIAFVAVVILLGRWRNAALAATAMAGLVAFAIALRPSTLWVEPDVPAIFTMFKSQPRQPVVLDLDGNYEWLKLWGRVAGVASYQTRRGEHVFCIRNRWHPIFTPGMQCTEDEIRGGTRMLATARTGPDTAADTVRLADLRFLHSPPRIRGDATVMVVDANAAQASTLLAQGWSTPEAEFTWSLGRVSTLEFRVDGPAPQRLALDLFAFLPSPDSRQQVQVSVNGQRLAQWEFSAASNRAERTLELPPGSVAAGGLVTVTLEVEQPRSPAATGYGADPRVLGVALRSLTVRSAG